MEARVSVASDMSEIGDDKVARERILPLLYVQRRRTMKRPGLGETEISRLLNTPLELAEFPLCYIKTKGSNDSRQVIWQSPHWALIDKKTLKILAEAKGLFLSPSKTHIKRIK